MPTAKEKLLYHSGDWLLFRSLQEIIFNLGTHNKKCRLNKLLKTLLNRYLAWVFTYFASVGAGTLLIFIRYQQLSVKPQSFLSMVFECCRKFAKSEQPKSWHVAVSYSKVPSFLRSLLVSEMLNCQIWDWEVRQELENEPLNKLSVAQSLASHNLMQFYQFKKNRILSLV